MSKKDVVVHELGDIRLAIEKLHLPDTAYAAIGVVGNEYCLAVMDGDSAVVLKEKAEAQDRHQEVIDWLKEYAAGHSVKIVAAAVVGMRGSKELCSRLWLEEDIVPYGVPATEDINEELIKEECRKVALRFDANKLVKIFLSPTREVYPSFLVTKDDYKKTVASDVWEYLEKEIEQFKSLDNSLVFCNATSQGGGVALMRHALLRFFRLFDLDVHWHAMQPSREVFEVTKTKFHNILQAVALEGVVLTDHDMHAYNSWSKENAALFSDAFRRAKVIVIDDPQPSGMVPHIQKYADNARIVYRSHIHLDNQLLHKEGSPQERTWQFIWNNIKDVDAFISHPVQKFIPQEFIEETMVMPATTDPLDGLNKELNEEQMRYYMGLFNKILLEHDQQMLDQSRPYIIQIARFDPSKGIPDVIESFRLLREKLSENEPAPQLVLVGHGSIDDPDGLPVYNTTIHLLQSPKYAHVIRDIKVVRLHHNDQILNALLRGSHIALQLSYKEGLEVKVTEALHKGKPVIAFRAGGIPLQIRDKETGFLVDIGDVQAVAGHLYDLFTNEELYKRMSNAAKEHINPHFFTVHNAIKWLYIANQLQLGNGFRGKCQSVSDAIGGPMAVGSIALKAD